MFGRMFLPLLLVGVVACALAQPRFADASPSHSAISVVAQASQAPSPSLPLLETSERMATVHVDGAPIAQGSCALALSLHGKLVCLHGERPNLMARALALASIEAAHPVLTMGVDQRATPRRWTPPNRAARRARFI